ncbi:hypothetical protein LPC08_04065 [Roseomonas sp. OT10]|uniref:hypothetical protein n=1 Tax=Roseomonas cutis TaxID=2897332 RepID=UPI001E505385|nr:hypothetical protein [Roseomonas sp. OT10]UFN49829.1 hypothetical protein LPC08_04065 [Roseomonas sp. OT10]
MGGRVAESRVIGKFSYVLCFEKSTTSLFFMVMIGKRWSVIMMAKKFLWPCVLLSAIGCSNAREEPMTELHVPGLFTRSTAEIGVISTGASYRIVTFRVNPLDRGDGNSQPAGSFCAEPPPDAAEAVASRIATSFEATGTVNAAAGESGNVQGAGSYERALATAVMAMTRRSQGLQFARDQTTSVCQDYLNGRIGREEYLRLRREIIAASVPLIKAEIDKLPNLNVSVVSAPSIAPSDNKPRSPTQN